MLKKNISIDELKFFDMNSKFGETGYNVGDLLNMPFYWANWPQVPHADLNMLNIALNTANNNPDTIVGLYYKDWPHDEPIPNLNRLNNVVKKYSDLNNIENQSIVSIIKDTNNLCVHLRSGDYGIVSEDFANKIFNFSKKFEKVIILCGLNRSRDLNENSENNIKSKNNLFVSLNKLLKKNDNIYLYFDEPDNHICLMYFASNLLLHKGGFSVIGSFINNNNIFLTNEFFPIYNVKWRREVEGKKITVC
jgi:hypothetical protein